MQHTRPCGAGKGDLTSVDGPQHGHVIEGDDPDLEPVLGNLTDSGQESVAAGESFVENQLRSRAVTSHESGDGKALRGSRHHDLLGTLPRPGPAGRASRPLSGPSG